MSEHDLSPEFLARLKKITGKRARIVIDHILEYGYITTEELQETYGYNHPPRAARDVRERGIPLETFYVTSSDGRKIGAYRFGDPADVQRDKLRGRKTFSKSFKAELLQRQANRCAICHTRYERRYLQIDHRVPYEVAGDTTGQRQITDYMLVCSTCNRAKSWSCEQCENWQNQKNAAICESCYWASPAEYEHVAMEPERRITITWQDTDVEQFDELQRQSQKTEESLQDYIKRLLKRNRKDDT